MRNGRVFWERFLAVVSRRLAADRAVYLLLALYCAAAVVYLCLRGEMHLLVGGFSLYFHLWVTDYLLIFPMLLAILGYATITLRLSARRALAYRSMFGAERLGHLFAGTVLIFAFLPFRSSFNALKATIPADHGFPFDVPLAAFDRDLHFGIDAWRLVPDVLYHPLVLRIVELNYNTLWFVICFGLQYWVATSRRFDALRVRYLVCFILTWAVGGTVLANLFASAGPVFYGDVTGDVARFGDLGNLLAQSSGQFGSARDYQWYLWDLYQLGETGLGSGISAFPSMHVALITMNALFLIEMRRGLAPWVLGYVGLTVASSVYLGWHYAIDSYASLALAAATYFGVKRLMSIRFILPRRQPVPTGAVVAASRPDS